MDPKPHPLPADDEVANVSPSPHEGRCMGAAGEPCESEDNQGGLRDGSPADPPPAGDRRGCVARTRPHRRAEPRGLMRPHTRRESRRGSEKAAKEARLASDFDKNAAPTPGEG